MAVADAPHPDSVILTPDKRLIELKVHRARWSGDYPDNSLPAVLECYRARVARAEIDFAMLRDADFLVVHDTELAHGTTGSGTVTDLVKHQAEQLRLVRGGRVTEHRPPLLSELVAAITAEPFPTRLELDMKDAHPWPWQRVEELARMLQPVKDRITFGGGADWNLRRLLEVDPTLPVGFTISGYLDWLPPDRPPELAPRSRGAYGYLDDHPLAWQRHGPTHDYLRDRLGGILRLVPGAREIHVRLLAVEQMRRDGLRQPAQQVHQLGMLLDVWTLDADTLGWHARLRGAIAAGADVITTNTAPRLAAAGRALPTAPS